MGSKYTSIGCQPRDFERGRFQFVFYLRDQKLVNKLTSSPVASHRAKNSLPALQTFTIDVISPTSTKLEHEDIEMLKQTKMSSTFIRDWIVKHRFSDGQS
jgi:hypothetical protein